MAFVDRLAARGHPHEVYVYETGHASFDVEEKIRRVRGILAFLARCVPGVSAFRGEASLAATPPG